jgi:outer membrane protein TolC
LAARAELHYGKPGINFFKKEWSLYFQGGITLKVPLFDWRKKKEELTMLDFKIRQLQTEKQKFLADTKKTLASLYARLEALQAKMKHFEKMVSYAKEKTQLKQQLWQEKLIPHLEYLTALSEEEKLAWSLEEIKFELQLTRVAINSFIGHYREVSQ